MNKKELTEGLAELAGVAERDHEVQMARADLYKIAKYAIKMHEMLKGVSEAEGMEGWQQSKITKAADYVGSVYHAMDYDNKFKGAPDIDLKAGAGTSSAEVNAAASAQQSSWKSDPSFGEEVTEARDTHCSDKCCGSDVKREDCTCPPTCKHCNCNAKNVDEGKSPHKKGSNKYKKHMAAKHANMSEGPFKGVGKQLMKRKLNKQYKKSDLANFDKSGIDTKGKTPDEVRQAKSDYYHDNMDKADRAKKASDRLSRNKKVKEAPGAAAPGIDAMKKAGNAKADAEAGDRKQAQQVAQKATALKGVVGGKASGAQVAKGLDKVAAGETLPPNIIKAIAPYATAIQSMMSNPQLFGKFKALMKQAEAGQNQQ